MKTDLDADTVRALLRYKPSTGDFLWIARASRNVLAGARAGTRLSNGYVSIRINKRSYLAHRLAWLVVHGTWPPGPLDHINGMKSDNRIANLRAVTWSGNSQNRAMHSDNTSGFRGVYRARTRWRAAIVTGQRNLSLGSFASPQEASAAYLAARSQLFTYQPIPRDLLK